MSHASARPPPSGCPESQAYTTIKFHLKQQNGNVSIQEADCLITSVIRGVKEDLQRQLGPPDNQNWYYQGQLMSDDKKLKDYGITGQDDEHIEVKP